MSVAVEEKHYLGHRKRLRERFLKSPEGMPDYEILEMLLFSASPRRDVKPLAKALLARFGGFGAVISAESEELSRVEGMNEGSIASLKLVREGALRLLKAEAGKKPVIESWVALLDYCRAVMGYEKREQFRVIFLNSKNMLIEDEILQEGTVNHTQVYPREIVRRALELSANSLILLHNHPSGDPSPSKADVEMTRQIIMAAAAVSLKVHDHVIITKDDYYSFKSNGLV